MGHNHQTAPTQFAKVGETEFAYRRFGGGGGVPLVFNQHILGNMDSWDPAVTDGLACNREVILFDNAGVGSSFGTVPHTFGEMAIHAVAFLDTLGLAKVDVMGFSMGAMIAQIMALDRPQLIRKLVLVGGAPRNGDGLPLPPRARALFEMKFATADDFWVDCLFADSPSGRNAGYEFLKRRNCRIDGRDLPPTEQAASAQFAALTEWGNPEGPRFAYLKNIQQPILVVHGEADIIVHSINAVYLKEYLPNAQLILYPEAAHGSLFQYPELFVQQACCFLEPSGSGIPFDVT